MTRYLNPVKHSGRHHSVVPHILGMDGDTALCVEGFSSWPRVSEGEWEIGDKPSDPDGWVCLRCLAKQKVIDGDGKVPPKAASAKERKAAQEKRRFEEWNQRAKEFGAIK